MTIGLVHVSIIDQITQRQATLVRVPREPTPPETDHGMGVGPGPRQRSPTRRAMRVGWNRRNRALRLGQNLFRGAVPGEGSAG